MSTSMLTTAFILLTLNLNCPSFASGQSCDNLFTAAIDKQKNSQHSSYADRLVSNPVDTLRDLREKVVSKSMLNLELSSEVERMKTELIKVELTRFDKPTRLLFTSLLSQVELTIREGAKWRDYIRMAAEFSILMDVYLNRRTIATPAARGGLAFSLGTIADPAAYYAERLAKIESSLARIDKTLSGYGGIQNVGIENFLIFWPSFRSLTPGEMVRSIGTQWLGLTAKVVRADNREMSPSDYFDHDLIHAIQILETVLRFVSNPDAYMRYGSEVIANPEQ